MKLVEMHLTIKTTHSRTYTSTMELVVYLEACQREKKMPQLTVMSHRMNAIRQNESERVISPISLKIVDDKIGKTNRYEKLFDPAM